MTYTTQDLYHRSNCSSDLMQMIGDKAEWRTKSLDELEDRGYDPCPECYPERAD